MKLVPTEQGYLEWSGEMILQLQAKSDRRLELLREGVELLYVLYNEYVVDEERTMEMIGKIEEELSDDK